MSSFKTWYKPGPVHWNNLNAIIRWKSNVTNKVSTRDGWHGIDWKKAETKINTLQEKIVIATSENDMREVYNLQWILLQSFEAKALAIRKVVTNKGGKTAGVDEVIWDSPEKYWKAIEELNNILKNPSEGGI